MGEKIVANVFLYLDERDLKPEGPTKHLYDAIMGIKEKHPERYEKLNMKTYPLTESGNILVERDPVKKLPTLKASVDLSDFATVHYIMGMKRQEVPIYPTEVDLGHGKTGVVTKIVEPYQPSIHAHLDADFDETHHRGMMLEFDFSKSKVTKFKEFFYKAKK